MIQNETTSKAGERTQKKAGPWPDEIVIGKVNGELVDPNGFYLSKATKREVIRRYKTQPELLEALKQITNHLCDVFNGPVMKAAGIIFANGTNEIPTIKQALTAIAKAEGKLIMTSNYKAQSERTDEAERLLVPPFVKTKSTLASKISQLTPIMRECYNYARDNGGTLHRYAGGHWDGKEWNGESKSFRTSTVNELVSRGFAVATEVNPFLIATEVKIITVKDNEVK